MNAEERQFWEQEAERNEKRVRDCPKCDSDGWCEPLGPYSDGSYITMRPCPNRCAEYAEEATAIRKFLAPRAALKD